MAEKKKPSKPSPATSKSKAPAKSAAGHSATGLLPLLDPGLIAAIVGGYHPQPHTTLGQHAARRTAS